MPWSFQRKAIMAIESEDEKKMRKCLTKKKGFDKRKER